MVYEEKHTVENIDADAYITFLDYNLLGEERFESVEREWYTSKSKEMHKRKFSKGKNYIKNDFNDCVVYSKIDDGKLIVQSFPIDKYMVMNAKNHKPKKDFINYVNLIKHLRWIKDYFIEKEINNAAVALNEFRYFKSDKDTLRKVFETVFGKDDKVNIYICKGSLRKKVLKDS